MNKKISGILHRIDSKWIFKELVNLLLIFFGILCAGMGLKGFLLSSHFIDGGVTGVSMLLTRTTNIPLYICLPIVNIPFIFLSGNERESLPDDLKDTPFLSKPVPAGRLVRLSRELTSAFA